MQANALVIQPDNKILVAGQISINDLIQCIIVRYNTDGSLDTSFNGGFITAPFGTSSYVLSLGLQSSGKILAAGPALFNNFNQYVLVRYLSDGTPDLSFGNSGLVTTLIGTNTLSAQLVVYPDESIVLMSSALNNLFSQFVLTKFTPNGIYDFGFGTNGIVTTAVGTIAISRAVACKLMVKF